MRFRLIYQGELKSSQKDPDSGQWDRMAEHKQAIRKVFHPQLKRLWETNKFLREHTVGKMAVMQNMRPVDTVGIWAGSNDEKISLAESVARNHQEFGYRFVPLVREDISLLCSLDILFLRKDHPGSIISAGDLDNRIKTLIDGLRQPKSANELRANEIPAAGEDPFYCLLEDDKSVTALTVETDTLLSDTDSSNEFGDRHVHIVITVELKPYHVTMFNLSFA